MGGIPARSASDRKTGLMTNCYIRSIVENIPAGETLNSIELHGFTTRDMCPCCFYHMLNFLLQANTNPKYGSMFFGPLLSALRVKGVNISTSLQISCYISSLVELGGREYKFSCYSTYDDVEANVVDAREKIVEKLAFTVSNDDLHCIFLRHPIHGEGALSQLGKTGEEWTAILGRANSLDKDYLNTDFYVNRTSFKPFPLLEIPRR